jgi:hypothetical protein
MKKLFAIAIAASMLGGLYGFSIGLGVAYDNLAGPEGTDPYFSVRADAMCKPLPVLGFRIGIIQIDLPTDATTYAFGTGVSADVLIFIPMAGMVSPYIPFGVWYHGNTGSSFKVKGGLGANMGFGGFMGYLEAGITFTSVSYGIEGVDDPDSTNPFYVQGGVRIPIGL